MDEKEKFDHYFSFSNIERDIISYLEDRVKDFLLKSKLVFNKDFIKKKPNIVTDLHKLDNAMISKLMLENLKDLDFVLDNLSVVKMVVEYLGVLKKNLVFHLKSELGDKIKKKSELDEVIKSNYYYKAIEYLIFLYRDVYLGRLEYLAEVFKNYKEVLSREITIRNLKE